MSKMIVAFCIVLLIYVSISVFVCLRGAQAFNLRGSLAICYYILFAILASSFIIGMGLDDILPIKVTSILQSVGGTFFFGVMFLFAGIVIVDLLRLINNLFGLITFSNYNAVKMYVAIGLISVVSVMFIYGNINFNRIKVKELNLFTGKGVKPVRIVMVADVHLGYTIGKERLQKFVAEINKQKPDVVFISGDLIDRSARPLIEYNMAEDLRQIKAPLGIYAVYGNHEYINNLSKSKDFIKEAGINLLIDSVATIGGRFSVVGRDDRTNISRKSISDLVSGLDSNYPVILLDHQPYNLEEAEEAGVDLQLSGHVHNGQTWPGNVIARGMYEISYGYGKKGNTHYYVTSGLGIWGPHIRVGTQSELVVINLN